MDNSVELLRRTPLYDIHVKAGGRMVPFAGWEMPVQYSGILAEHQSVRQRAGLFDVSHMGEVFLTGKEAEKALQYLTCNDIKKMSDGSCQYNAITNPGGGIVDDIMVYRYSPEKYLICVNASNADKDFDWFVSHNKFDASFENKSNLYGQLALQGPLSENILKKALGAEAIVPHFRFKEGSFGQFSLIIARTGYTGEDGFEIFVPAGETCNLWSLLMEAGGEYGLLPCGLGARDTLRLESCYSLYGHELSDEVSALESGLGWIVKLDKGDFVGKGPLQALKTKGVPRNLVGFIVDDPGIVRAGDKLYKRGSDDCVGQVTSGTKSPTLNISLGMALINSSEAAVETVLDAEVRGKKLKCHVAPKPFYKRGK